MTTERIVMKRRYLIKDIEDMLDIHRKTYYYWERNGKIPKAKRDKMSNYRYWTEEDVQKLMTMTGRGEFVGNIG